jgi:membrane protein required for colicin V production
MGTFDIILAVILLIGFIKGLKDGLFVEAASLVGLVAGVYGAIHFSYIVGDYLKVRVNWDEKYITLTAFAITFAVIVLVIALAGKMLTKLANFAQLGWINKIAGGLFGSLKWALIISVVLLVFDRFNSKISFVSPEDKAKSILFEPVKNLAPTLFPDFIRNLPDKKDVDETKPVEEP